MIIIDWFTVIAQIVNFLILVALLTRFLYRPILKIMDDRERTIAERLNEASQKGEVAEREAASYRQQLSELDVEREKVLTAARHDADRLRHEMMARVRKDAEEARARWLKSLEQEQSALTQHLVEEVGTQSCAIARRALLDLADIHLERHIVAVFLQRLRDLDDGQRAALSEATRRERQVLIVSSFDLPADLQQQFREAVQDVAGREARAHFEASPGTLCGIELRVNGYKLAWTMAGYLDELKDSLAGALAPEGGMA